MVMFLRSGGGGADGNDLKVGVESADGNALKAGLGVLTAMFSKSETLALRFVRSST